MQQKQTVKTHRVGTVTFGCLLIVFGVLFLGRLFMPTISYELIFHLWPCTFILLGVEVLLANRRMERQKEKEDTAVSFVYDKAAIFLMLCLAFFAMFMAFADYWMQYRSVCL